MPRQRGAALLIFSIIIVMAALAYLVSSLAPDLSEASRERKTQEALAQAREALIGHALKYRESFPDRMYGYLPLPDLGNSQNNNAGCPEEGCDAANFSGNALYKTVIGRLPWRTLGIEPLRDSNGECLWYAVSGSHQRIQRVSPMNWDTLSHLDVLVADNSATLVSALTNAHDRPAVIIFSPGPPLSGQNRSTSASDNVAVCGGNYDVKNYLDPDVATALGGVTNYLANCPNTINNSACGVTGNTDPSTDPAKTLSTRGKVFESGGNFLPNACQGANCNLVANDSGLELTGDTLFGAIRKHAYFRTDINSLLDRITDCLRDQAVPGGHSKIADHACYGSTVVPVGYYPNYKDMIYVAGGTPSVNGAGCAGALLFGSQRNTGQLRDTATNRGITTNYLEPPNLAGPYSGTELFERVSPTQSVSRDIVRCIPTTRSFVTTASPGLAAAGLSQLAEYAYATRTLTLGRTVAAPLVTVNPNFLYGCAWRPESRTLGSGLRSYFTFRILDGGFVLAPAAIEGFTFTVVDGDNNGTDACGAAAQHLGYSGNNTESPFIAPPKIAFEIDPLISAGFVPTLNDHLNNGRNDPNYAGGHVGITYWGGETAFSAMPFAAPPALECTPPAYNPGSGANCYLPQEEDDNVHGVAAAFRSGFAPPPANPIPPAAAPSVPPDSPAGAYKLDPASPPSLVPVDPQFFHVRVELTRTTYTRVATTPAIGNLTLNIPPAVIGGVTMATGDKVWVRYQTTSSENGLYAWNGAAIPMTRTSDGEGTSNYDLPRVRVASTGNIDLNAPDIDSVDGVYLFEGDRVLLKNQFNPVENGVYDWSSPTSKLERALIANKIFKLNGLVVEVQQGTQNAKGIWRQNTIFPATCQPLDDPTTCNQGISWTNLRVKVATSSAIALNNPGPEIDGIKLKSGDRVLVKNNGGQNGVYRWNGATALMTTEPDVIVGSSIVQVQQGSEATALWLAGSATPLSPVRVASQSNLNLAAPPGVVDGATLAAGDRVLVMRQTNAAENGIYFWNGATLVRAADADAATELAGAITQILEGTSAGRIYRQTAMSSSGTPNLDSVQWASIDRSTSYLLEIWILPDTILNASKIEAMKNTTRPMSLQYPTFTPHLQDRPVIPYSFRNARIGFTTGQSTAANDQTISISDYFTTWLE